MKLLHPTPNWNSAPHETWRRWQAARLRDYLSSRVLPFSAHYRRVFAEHDIEPGDIRTLDDWSRVPFTSKSDLAVPREQQREFVLIPDEAALRRDPGMIFTALLHGRSAAKAAAEAEFRPVLLTSTTGRSAEPVPFLYTKHDLKNLDLTGERIMLGGRSQHDFRHVNLFPYAPHLAFWQTHHAGLGFGTFMVSSGGGKTMGTEGNIKLIDKIQPDIIIGMPTFMYHLMLEAVEQKKCWPNLKRIVIGGEKAAEGLRARLRDLAAQLGSPGVHVMAVYGFTEAKMAFPECVGDSSEAASTGYHLSPDLGIVELIDPKTGKVVPDGEPGEVVFTPLDSRGTVVMRYRTGDIAEGGLSWEKCPNCGRTCQRLLGPISRVSEVRELYMDKLKGTLVNFNLLEHLLDDQKGIVAWQIELRKRHDDPLDTDEVHLHLTAEPGVRESDLKLAVTRRFHEATEITPNALHFHPLAEMREQLGVGLLLKEEKLVDHRPKTAAASSVALSS
ncbi:MAG: AMP-binding protein [Prosthecobacter sp.]|jgi:phenylacetate-CoA ligase|uniref:phenylacetate--CoA ligase family protein n=1 Tax=Prosthecobacter sp. TaxID=1965333 RepID=UPI0019DE3600|nr:AMP-binding protein [Prosthecobacter sp.]MBE2282471.1 AMP-binding protein [Prosthecobacter sp.]